MKIALVAQNATPLNPRVGSGPDHDDIGLSELTRKLAGQGHQVTVYAQKSMADAPRSIWLAARSASSPNTGSASPTTPSCSFIIDV